MVRPVHTAADDAYAARINAAATAAKIAPANNRGRHVGCITHHADAPPASVAVNTANPRKVVGQTGCPSEPVAARLMKTRLANA